ncbi:hypothetical protein E8E14_004811 [Neopestalotiopsis sp. 37M]|nr:hypothetical protein E8E14_004811 [Neopestalotiopsis sp. 37M]
MSQLSEPSPPRLSTGAELEFAVIYVFDTDLAASGSQPGGKIIEDELPQPLEVAHPTGVDQRSLNCTGLETVQTAISKTLKDAGFPTKVQLSGNPTEVALQIDRYRHCEVEQDNSVKGINLEQYGAKVTLHYAAIEVRLPVEWESTFNFVGRTIYD